MTGGRDAGVGVTDADYRMMEAATGIFAEAFMLDPDCSISVGAALKGLAMARLAAEAAAQARVAELEAVLQQIAGNNWADQSRARHIARAALRQTDTKEGRA